MTMPSYIINWEDIKNEVNLAGKYKIIEGIRDLEGIQKIKGYAQSVPLVGGEYKIVDDLAKGDIVITSVTYSQSSYSPEDYWELWINGDRIFETIYTKELGEVKSWEMIQYLSKGDIVTLVHHNNSSTSKDVWVDIEYVLIRKKGE